MKMNRLTVLVTILVVVSLGSNIFTYWKEPPMIWPDEVEYRFDDMFLGGALMYRPEGSTGLEMIDLSRAIVTVTEFGAPMNCAKIIIHTNSGMIAGECVEGQLDE